MAETGKRMLPPTCYYSDVAQSETEGAMASSNPDMVILYQWSPEVVKDQEKGWNRRKELLKEKEETDECKDLEPILQPLCLFPTKRKKRRSSAKWFLLFCLSQFVVDLFTFLLVPHCRPVLRLVLRRHLLGAPQRGTLLIFGFPRWSALACRCGSRLFGFRARGTIPVNLRMSDSKEVIPELK